GRLPDRVLHLDVQRVHLGAVDPDGGDAALGLHPHELAHARPSSPSPRGRRRTPSDSHGPTLPCSSSEEPAFGSSPRLRASSRLDLATAFLCHSATACSRRPTAIWSLALGFS